VGAVKVTLDYNSNELELTDTSVVIRNRGALNAMAAGISGEREIGIGSITGVQLKLGGFLPGYIRFSYAGDRPFAGGLYAAAQDPDVFMFNKSGNDQVLALKKLLDEKMRALKSHPLPPQTFSLADEIAKLAKLKDEELLTGAEFDAAKKRLLG
jgi:hypothetical protein